MVLVNTIIEPPHIFNIKSGTHPLYRESDYCPIFDDEISEQKQTPLQVWDIVRKKYGTDNREGRIIQMIDGINAVIIWSNHDKPLGEIWDKQVQEWYDQKSIFPECFPLAYLVLVYRQEPSIPIPKIETQREINKQLSLF